jgi:hypothetical protein
MNRKKLKAAEQRFLDSYPMGFLNPELHARVKKHRMEKMVAQSHELFAKNSFADARSAVQSMNKVIGRSSMVSVFEKPKFRDLIPTLDNKHLGKLTGGLKDFLHGNREKGFTAMVDVLAPAKLAKWSLVTIIPNYYWPDKEVFVKPTTAKGVIEFFELKGLVYKPYPTWEFYEAYRTAILEMKSKVDKSIAPSNAAFCGFLMMSLNAGNPEGS